MSLLEIEITNQASFEEHRREKDQYVWYSVRKSEYLGASSLNTELARSSEMLSLTIKHMYSKLPTR